MSIIPTDMDRRNGVVGHSAYTLDRRGRGHSRVSPELREEGLNGVWIGDTLVPAEHLDPSSASTSIPDNKYAGEFVQETRGEYESRAFDAFVSLPGYVVAEAAEKGIGFATRYGRTAGNLRVDLLCLSYAAGMWKLHRGDVVGEFRYADGVVVSIPADQSIFSMERVAHAILRRIHKRTAPEGHADPIFEAIYAQVKRAFVNLERSDLIHRIGPAREDVKGKRQDVYGIRWTFTGTLVEDADLEWDRPRAATIGSGLVVRCVTHDLVFRGYPTRSSASTAISDTSMWTNTSDGPSDRRPPLRKQPAANGSLSPDSSMCSSTSGPVSNEDPARSHRGIVIPDNLYVDEYPVASIFEELHRAEMVTQYRAGAAKTGGFVRREREVSYFDWQQRISRRSQIGAARHVSVGAFREGLATAETRSDNGCVVPYLIAEIDAPDAAESLMRARQLLERLEDLGADLCEVVVTYSGNRSFHIRIPHGAVGVPLYDKAKRAKHVIRGFFEELCAPIGGLFETLDTGLFSPTHLIRAVGSLHENLYEATGEKRYCVAFTGEEIDKLSLLQIQQYSYCYSSFTLTDPATAKRCEALVELFTQAIAGSGNVSKRKHENRGIIDRIKEGVEKGEEFYPGYIGRNMAALLLTEYMLISESRDESDAWGELRRWNGALAQPMSGTELRGVFRNGEKYVKCRAA